MSTIGEKIYQLRLMHQISQVELAEIAGVTDKAVSTWEIGVKRPRIQPLKRIIEHFDLPEEEWLNALGVPGSVVMPEPPRPVRVTHRVKGGIENGHVVSADLATSPPLRLSEADLQRLANAYCVGSTYVQTVVCQALGVEFLRPIPAVDYKTVEMIVYNDPASCGDPLYADSEYERITLPEMMVAPGADFGVRISGDSMSPTIRNGQIVWVRKQFTLRDQEIGVFMLGDSAVCKRLSLPPFARSPRLLSDNPKYPAIEGMDLEDLRVIGRVFL